MWEGVVVMVVVMWCWMCRDHYFFFFKSTLNDYLLTYLFFCYLTAYDIHAIYLFPCVRVYVRVCERGRGGGDGGSHVMDVSWSLLFFFLKLPSILFIYLFSFI